MVRLVIALSCGKLSSVVLQIIELHHIYGNYHHNILIIVID